MFFEAESGDYRQTKVDTDFPLYFLFYVLKKEEYEKASQALNKG